MKITTTLGQLMKMPAGIPFSYIDELGYETKVEEVTYSGSGEVQFHTKFGTHYPGRDALIVIEKDN